MLKEELKGTGYIISSMRERGKAPTRLSKDAHTRLSTKSPTASRRRLLRSDQNPKYSIARAVRRLGSGKSSSEAYPIKQSFVAGDAVPGGQLVSNGFWELHKL